MKAAPTLAGIVRKLHAWELLHLREHAAALEAEVERLQAENAQLRDEVDAADARADMFHDMANLLQDATSARIGITPEGQVGLVQGKLQ